MTTAEEIVLRWKTNAHTLSIPLTDEDIERIGAAGVLDRITMIEEILLRTSSNNVVPDYLSESRSQDSASE